MRVISWNCNMAFRKKDHEIIHLNPDLLIIPECECPEKLSLPTDMNEPNSKVWAGENPHKGIGVFAYSDLELTLDETYNPEIQYALPVRVKGREEFNLLAIWAQNNKQDRRRRYIGQVWLAIHEYKHLLNEPILIVGDFNWNKIWDDSGNLCGNLTQTIEYLKSKNIFSLYHEFYQEAFGQETRPTLYMYRKQDRPYHVDYLFASSDLAVQLEALNVGAYDNWHTLSDHMPIVATFKQDI